MSLSNHILNTMSKLNFSLFLTCLILTASFSSCKSKTATDADHPLMVAYTSGVISILSPVRVALTDDDARENRMPGNVAPNDVFKFSPSVAGKAGYLLWKIRGKVSDRYASVRNTINAFQDFSSHHPVEKIYLHLDKPHYVAGEYMYFRAYLTDIHLNQENVESRKIYVELSDAEKKLIKRVLLYSEENEYTGQILLPDSLPAANYHIRAYTNWMRNAVEDYFYHRNIYIGNTATQKQEVTSQEFDYQVTFFPESGQLLSGFFNKP